jgi:hypothetical protein
MPKKYLYKRFRWNPMPKPFRLQPQDLEVLMQLADYRFLDTYQILALQPRGLRILPRRLQYLFHAGLVDRPPRQHDFLQPPGPVVYGLGNKGAEVLASALEVERGKVDWQTKNREAGLPYIEHTLMISRFRSSLTLALNSLKGANITTWQQGPQLKAEVKLKGQRLAVIPDGYFTIQHKGQQHHFFLEADRRTMTTKRYLRKLRACWLWWKTGGHQRKFSIPRFRVLTLTTSEKRKENLRTLAKLADDGKCGSPMFLFACEKSFELQRPSTILNPIWQSPLDDAQVPLLPESQ